MYGVGGGQCRLGRAQASRAEAGVVVMLWWNRDQKFAAKYGAHERIECARVRARHNKGKKQKDIMSSNGRTLVPDDDDAQTTKRGWYAFLLPRLLLYTARALW